MLIIKGRTRSKEVHSNYNKRIAKNYAQVLFDTSIEKKATDALFNAFILILKEVKANFLLKRLFKNPLLSKEDQKKVILNLVDESLAPFFFFIIQKKRLPLLDLIGETFIDLFEHHKNRGRAYLETAHPFTEKQKKALTEKMQRFLSLEALEIEETINPRLLGGFRLKVKGKIFDASLATQAQNILKESHV
jgi:F-type H+-transporting ATPase subunit delta